MRGSSEAPLVTKFHGHLKGLSFVLLQTNKLLYYRAYVERAFDKCVVDSDRSAMEAELKKIITKAIGSEELWNVDWDNEDLPSLPGEKKDNDKTEKAKKKAKRKAEFTLEQNSAEIAQRQRRQKRFGAGGGSTTSRPTVTQAYIPGVAVCLPCYPFLRVPL